MPPERDPTIRSVPDIVFVKLARAPVLTFSTPSISTTDTAREKIVRRVVNFRFITLFTANRKIITCLNSPMIMYD